MCYIQPIKDKTQTVVCSFTGHSTLFQGLKSLKYPFKASHFADPHPLYTERFGRCSQTCLSAPLPVSSPCCKCCAMSAGAPGRGTRQGAPAMEGLHGDGGHVALELLRRRDGAAAPALDGLAGRRPRAVHSLRVLGSSAGSERRRKPWRPSGLHGSRPSRSRLLS